MAKLSYELVVETKLNGKLFKLLSNSLCQLFACSEIFAKLTMRHMLKLIVSKCQIHFSSPCGRYHIGRQTLYVNFNFTREKMVGREWIAMDEDPHVQLVLLRCVVIDSDPHIEMEFNVGKDWPLLHLRQEVQIAMGTDAPTEFTFFVTGGNGPDRKINRRSEKYTTVSEVLPPQAATDSET